MKRQTVAAVLGVGIGASQAGHLLAYTLRFGAAAGQMQSAGAHAYFPSMAKTVLGLIAFAMVAGLLVVAAARVIGGRSNKATAPPFLRLVAVLFTIQLAAFALQETAESLLTGAAASVPLVLVWGTVGQLPVAAAGAIALRWLLASVPLALVQLALHVRPAVQVVTGTTAPVVFPIAAQVVLAKEAAPAPFNWRGPPSY